MLLIHSHNLLLLCAMQHEDHPTQTSRLRLRCMSLAGSSQACIKDQTMPLVRLPEEVERVVPMGRRTRFMDLWQRVRLITFAGGESTMFLATCRPRCAILFALVTTRPTLDGQRELLAFTVAWPVEEVEGLLLVVAQVGEAASKISGAVAHSAPIARVQVATVTHMTRQLRQ